MFFALFSSGPSPLHGEGVGGKGLQTISPILQAISPV